MTVSVGSTWKSMVLMRRVTAMAPGEADGQADEDQRHALADDSVQDGGGTGAHRHADADLAGPLADPQSEHGANAGDRDHQRERGVQAEETGEGARRGDGAVPRLFHGFELRNCGVGVHVADGPAERGHGRGRLAHRTDQQGSGLGVLRQWDIDARWRFAVGTVVLHVADDANDAEPGFAAAEADAAADGIGVAPTFGGERAADDGDGHGIGAVRDGECAAGGERDSECLEVAGSDAEQRARGDAL